MGISADDYTGMLLGLLPPGPAWPQEDSQIARMLSGWAQELARLDARSANLVEEADPRTTEELLPDWERVAGLPGLCSETGITLTEGQRRQLLVAKLISQGGQSRQYYIAVAAALGYTITITEFSLHTCLKACDYPLIGEEWIMAWQVNASDGMRTYFNCLSQCDEPLSRWGNFLLECALNAIKPAHTVLLFSYT